MSCGGDRPPQDSYTVEALIPGDFGGLRIELLPVEGSLEVDTVVVEMAMSW